LVDTVHKFRDIMIPQLDLSIEAKHLQRFNRDFENDPNVTFPKPIPEFTTPRVLTETFIHGTPILQYATESASDRKELALLGLTTTLKMIFINDFLHGTSILDLFTLRKRLQIEITHCGPIISLTSLT
jgi:aarF domain-containing kinase